MRCASSHISHMSAQRWKKKVIDRGILSKVMYPAFTKQIYQKALSAPDVASAIGTNVDELLRHVPELGQHGVEMLYKIFDQIRKTCEKRCEYAKSHHSHRNHM